MKALLDTCVVMDFLQNRSPFADDAKKILRAAARDLFNGYITAKSATDIYYLTHRCTHSAAEAKTKLNSLLSIIGMLDSTAEDVLLALSFNTSDFEDAVMIETAYRSHIDYIITRNSKDYQNSPVPVLSPSDFLLRLKK